MRRWAESFQRLSPSCRARMTSERHAASNCYHSRLAVLVLSFRSSIVQVYSRLNAVPVCFAPHLSQLRMMMWRPPSLWRTCCSCTS